MSQKKNKTYDIVKWLIMIVAYVFLAYKLANVEYWEELKKSFSTINFNRFLLLIAVIVLMPLNWSLEAIKWQILTRKYIKLGFKDAVKAVLAGLNTGFITPSRIGDFAGRIMHLPSELRMTGTMLTFVNGTIQTLVVTFTGLISAYFYSLYFKSLDIYRYLRILGIVIVVIVIVVFIALKTVKRLRTHKWARKIMELFNSLSELDWNTIIVSFFISLIRFGVFCFQYYLLLKFFNVQLTPVEGLIGIPTMYFLVAYAPQVAASEAAVRASMAVLVLGVFSNNEIGILLTGILIWLINFILPMLAGAPFVVRKDDRAKNKE